MFDFIRKFVYSFLKVREQVLGKECGANYSSTYSNSTSKRAYGVAASLELSSKTELNKIKLEKNIKLILKKYANDPQKLLDYIQRSGTNIYKIPFAEKFLKLIGLETGLINKLSGLKGLYVNIITSAFSGAKLNLSCSTEHMFILSNVPLNNYNVILQFHKWYALKLNLPGFDVEAQNNFQKFFIQSNDEKIKELGINEILGLKEAIARDVEAINFVVDLAKSTAGSRNALKKMKTGGASI